MSSLFGQFLMERNVIDADQLKDALEYQGRNHRLLGELAVEKGFLGAGDVHRVIERQWREDREFGEMAVSMGLISENQLDELLREQKSNHIALGEALIRLGALNRQTLDSELEEYARRRDEYAEPSAGDKCDLRQNPLLCFFDTLGKVLPRVTAGRFIPGGLYPTIQEKPFDYAISSRVRGDVDFEVVLLMPENLLESLGDSVLKGGGGRGLVPGHGKVQVERASKAVLDIAVRHFIHRQARQGISLESPSGSRRISENTFHARRLSAARFQCAEVLLVSPPSPRGDFLQFDLCLMMKK